MLKTQTGHYPKKNIEKKLPNVNNEPVIVIYYPRFENYNNF